jgi:hypothetical protein
VKVSAATLILLLALAAAASASPVRIPLPIAEDQIGSEVTTFSEDPVAVSMATGSAVQAVDRGRRGVAIVRRTASGPPVVLARVDDPAPRVTTHLSLIAASATAWVAAVTGGRSDHNQGEAGEDIAPLDEIVLTGSLAGGPVRRLVSCRSHTAWLDLAIAGGDVGFSRSSCAGSRGVWMVPAGGAPRRLAPDGILLAMSSAAALVRAGETSMRLYDFAGGSSVVAGMTPFWHSAFDDGGQLLTMHDTELATVGTDGSVTPVASVPDAGDTLNVGFVAGGGRALAPLRAGDGVVAISAASGAVAYAGAGDGDAIGAEPLGVDATRAAWVSDDCTGHPNVVIDETVPSRHAPTGVQPCPVSFASQTLLAHGRRVALRASCPEGCAARFDVRSGKRTIATGSFTLARGQTRTVHLALNRRGRALLARRHSVAGRLVQTDGWLYRRPPALAVTVHA